MLQAVSTVKSQLLKLRTEDQFDELYNNVTVMCADHGLDPVTLPRRRRPPSRYSGNSEAYQCETPQEYYRSAFYTVIDSAVMQISDRFDNEKARTEEILIT